MKTFKKLLPIIFTLAFISVMLLVTATTASAETYSGKCGDNLTWILDTETGILNVDGKGAMYDYGYTSTGNGIYNPQPWLNYISLIKFVVIGDRVTSVGESAFMDCDFLLSVEISDTVKTIGKSAFYCCYSLSDVILGDSVTTIGENAFYRCDELSNLTIGKSIKSIGDGAFYGCDYINQVNISDMAAWCNLAFTSAPFGYSYSIDFYLNGELLKDLVIPETVTKISDYAFENCHSLKTVTIPKSVLSIGIYAFHNCKSLSSVTIQDSVTSIGEGAFSECEYLRNIVIPDSVKKISDGAIPDSVTINCNTGSSADNYAIKNGNDVKYLDSGYARYSGSCSYDDISVKWSIFTGDGILYITGCGEMMDYSWFRTDWVDICGSEIKEAVVCEGVTHIGQGSFRDCDALTKVTIPASVTSIGDEAFSSCKSIKSIVVDSKNKNYTVYNNVLYNKNKTTLIKYLAGNTKKSFEIPSTVTEIEIGAFEESTYLTNVTIAGKVKTIGESAFYKCKALKTVTIGNSVETIGSSAFNSCDALTKVTIGNSVKTIENYAFRNCTSLASINVPDSVTYIGWFAFEDTAYINNAQKRTDGVLYIGKHLIYADETVASTYYVKDGTVTMSAHAFTDSVNLKNIVIPESVISIDDRVFADYRGQIAYNRDVTIHAVKGSSAITYAEKEELKYEFICTKHSFGSWKVSAKATCSKAGVETRKCKNCIVTETKAIAKLKHTYTDILDTKCNNCSYTRAKHQGKTLAKIKGVWTYVVNGEISKANTLVKYNGKWYHVNGGKLVKDTTLVKYAGKWYYVKNGVKNTSTTLVKYNGKWYYVKKGVKSTDTTLVKYNNKWYYVKKGVKSTDTTLVKYNNKWYYVYKGIKNSSNAIVKYNGKWYYVEDGVKNNRTVIFIQNNKWYYINCGIWDSDYTGNLKVQGVIYYFENGVRYS